MIEPQKLLISIGTNVDHEEKMAFAKKYLRGLFSTIVFTNDIWTDPINIVSDRFLNCLALTTTKHGLKQMERALKQIEKKCGDSKSKRSENIIAIDIDILQYGNQRLNEEDWNREYIQALIKELAI
ncbi:MAG: 2-amino-4-hydroxy-6-hydroxymethyldihydropteridine diphosphokinase [Prevotella sp.]|nr:2-amino-4-hydroxy-6-hydroxymethyldihydropteridine diphosphokinase [Prevotella sp.]